MRHLRLYGARRSAAGTTPSAGMLLGVLVLAICLVSGCSSTSPADGLTERRGDRQYDALDSLQLPEDALPPPGACRIWYLDLTPDRQPPPGDCNDLYDQVPPGARLIRG